MFLGRRSLRRWFCTSGGKDGKNSSLLQNFLGETTKNLRKKIQTSEWSTDNIRTKLDHRAKDVKEKAMILNKKMQGEVENRANDMKKELRNKAMVLNKNFQGKIEEHKKDLKKTLENKATHLNENVKGKVLSAETFAKSSLNDAKARLTNNMNETKAKVKNINLPSAKETIKVVQETGDAVQKARTLARRTRNFTIAILFGLAFAYGLGQSLPGALRDYALAKEERKKKEG